MEYRHKESPQPKKFKTQASAGKVMLTVLIKIQPDATGCRYLFTAKSLYMFRVSQHPSSGVPKTVTAASGTGHNTGTATSLQRGLIGHVGGKSSIMNCTGGCGYSF